MKKIIAITSAILLVTALTFSVQAFRDDEPKKQKSECAAEKSCDKENTASVKSEASSGCQKSSAAASENCSKKEVASTDNQ